MAQLEDSSASRMLKSKKSKKKKDKKKKKKDKKHKKKNKKHKNKYYSYGGASNLAITAMSTIATAALIF